MNIWILTEEKPKKSVLESLINIYYTDILRESIDLNFRDVTIAPVIVDSVFQFKYELSGLNLYGINNIYIKTVSGNSSFVDFLFFKQTEEPTLENNDLPLFAIEETKTSDLESRNTGVYQRGSKFVFIKNYYDVPLYMLYNDEIPVENERKPSDTNIFGTNMLLTMGVNIRGKEVSQWFRPFTSIDEVIAFKDGMRRPPANNIPVLLTRNHDTIFISGRLDKPRNIGKISHDPNIGALSMIAATLRNLSWNGNIVITRHNITQDYVDSSNGKNKFFYNASLLNMSLDGLEMPSNITLPLDYWKYEENSEKLASILFHIMAENIGMEEIYHNHAGSERGYFKVNGETPIALPKVTPDGDLLHIPDVIMADHRNRIIYIVEGKQLRNIHNGLAELDNFDNLERLYLTPNFPNYEIKRVLTINGGELSELPNDQTILYLSRSGKLIINF